MAWPTSQGGVRNKVSVGGEVLGNLQCGICGHAAGLNTDKRRHRRMREAKQFPKV